MTMKLIKSIALAISVSLSIASCSVFEKSASIEKKALYQNNNKEQGTLFWAQYDASKRGSMIFVDPDNNVRVLSENPPDVAMQTITELSTKIKGTGEVSEVEAILKTQQSVAELGKRTAAVNMLRDALYRLNEMYYSTRDEKKELLKLDYQKFSGLMVNNDIPDSAKVSAASLLQPTLSQDKIKDLFQLIIENTKEISVEESKASISVEESRSKAVVANAKLKEQQFIALMLVFEATKDEMTEKEKKELLNKILAIKNI